MNTTPHVSVDVGGTFTDVVLITEDGLTTAKVPSTADQSDGVLDGIRKVCGKGDIPVEEVQTFSHAMTVSVNALLERAGAETALITTAGFGDVVEIGRQTRERLYDLFVERTDPLVPRHRRYELDERATTEGIEIAVSESEVDELANELEGIESVAISFLHSYSEPENEAAVADRLRDRLEVPVSVSHELLPAFREYERTSTTVVDAYVRPAIDTYLGRLTDRARTVGLPEPRVIQSNGGTADIETVRKRGVSTILSGPAAGVVGAEASAERAIDAEGLHGLVTFDMGGTSSDVSLIQDGEIARTTDAEVAGHPIALPMIDIETVGSGGGSIAWVDEGGALRVGPRSAGADPGPACYGNGGTKPTVTDANVVLGYISEDASLGGEVSLDADAAHDALAALAERAGLDSALEAATGIYRIANATMTRAIRSVTVESGYDPRNFGLVAFGGAGPMHAAALADDLGIQHVVIPLACGVLSAYGLAAADEKHDAMRTHRMLLSDADPQRIKRIYRTLVNEIEAEASTPEEVSIERTAALRYDGQSFELDVSVGESFDSQTIRERFHAAHERAYGYRMNDPIELVELRVTGRIEAEPLSVNYTGETTERPGSRTAYFDDEPHTIDVFSRNEYQPNSPIDGPAVLEDDESTAVVPPAWSGTVRGDGSLVLRQGETR